MCNPFLVSALSIHAHKFMSLQQAIFDEITTFEKPLDCVSLRRFTQSNKIYLTEPHTIGFPKASSDFTLDEGSAQGTRWRDRSGFVEIKASVRDTPEVVRAAPDGSTVKGIVVQASNYARLHLAGSPFQLFSLGMLIFGMKFSVGFFDRGGVTLSPIYDVLDSTGYFIRVVRQITEVSRITLGRDPSVRELLDDGPDDDDLSILSTTSHLRSSDGKYPIYHLCLSDAEKKDNISWCTVGPPIWTSLSLLGRGTEIWRVAALKDNAWTGKVLVMKSAWRSDKRISESDIYMAIKDLHPGIAEYSHGADVTGPDGHVISVDSLRLSPKPGNPGNPILHRLFLKTLGRPIWKFNSELGLFKGVLAALKGS